MLIILGFQILSEWRLQLDEIEPQIFNFHFNFHFNLFSIFGKNYTII